MMIDELSTLSVGERSPYQLFRFQITKCKIVWNPFNALAGGIYLTDISSQSSLEIQLPAPELLSWACTHEPQDQNGFLNRSPSAEGIPDARLHMLAFHFQS